MKCQFELYSVASLSLGYTSLLGRSTSCVSQLIRNYISSIPSNQPHAKGFASKDMGIQNVHQFEGSYTVLLYVTLYTSTEELLE